MGWREAVNTCKEEDGSAGAGYGWVPGCSLSPSSFHRWLSRDRWRAGRSESCPSPQTACSVSLSVSPELSKHQWDAADDIHRSLMVDHVTEVSQWMVGVKRLIAEKRSLSSEETASEEQSTATTKENQTAPGVQQDP